ncbi:hypothetical protein [Acholeplasma laidlawii]|uniref:hypothetical protein n=1 Tax=Acholeplasma laidlawii TaxID=2148 RepID=UPI0021F79767|nr:hypothetical protein [Acholeplasma laidlawii]
MKVRKFVWETVDDNINDVLDIHARVLKSLSNIGVDYIHIETKIVPYSLYEGVQFYCGNGTLYLLEDAYETFVKSGDSRFEMINPEYPDIIHVLMSEDIFTDIEVNQFVNSDMYYLINDISSFEPTLGVIPLSVIREKKIDRFETKDGTIIEEFHYVRLTEKGEFYDISTGEVLKPVF